MREHRVFRVIKKISADFFQGIKYYSVKLALFCTGETIFQSLRLKNMSRYFQVKKTDYVLEYLKIRYGYVFTKSVNEENKGENATSTFGKPIWI